LFIIINMKSKIFIAFFFLLSTHIFAQSSNKYFDYNGKDLTTFLHYRFKYPYALFSKCSMPFVYVKFKVKNNAVDSFSFSNNDKDLVNEISKELRLTNGYWNAKKTAGKWIIVPIFFHIQYEVKPPEGCDISKHIDQQFGNISDLKFPSSDQYIYFPPVIILSAYYGSNGNVMN